MVIEEIFFVAEDFSSQTPSVKVFRLNSHKESKICLIKIEPNLDSTDLVRTLQQVIGEA